MHRLKVITLAVLTLLFVTAQAHADMNIKFDDLGTTQGFIPDGYMGLHWSNFYYMNGIDTDPAGPIIGDPSMLGYRNGVVSRSNIAYNGFGFDAAFFVDPGSSFTLTSAYFTSTAYWLNTSYVDIAGFLNGNQVGSDHLAINSNTPVQETFNWLVDGVAITTATDTAAGFDVAVDNIQLGAAVPEPGAVLLLGTVGLALLPLVRRLACRQA